MQDLQDAVFGHHRGVPGQQQFISMSASAVRHRVRRASLHLEWCDGLLVRW
ncbi:hypothetical protein [Streptomyces demainii]|uniref:Transposase n=1 Tax=Streptomyces demainii TaxID=588122 RepID=A0ABT9KT05_9ACTN|nr:hypothetical protein [Streptomyces demainii]MDP9611530.1 hypothetical protein [Streptomyces demainii]